MTFLVDWGVSCSQGGCKENQDGWFVSVPPKEKSSRKKKTTTGGGSSKTKEGKYERVGISKGVWNLDPIQPSMEEAGTFSHSKKSVDDAFPPVFSMLDLPPLPPKKGGPGWATHLTGGRVENSENACFFGILDGHGHYGKTASHVGAYCLSQTLNKEVPDIESGLSVYERIDQVVEILNKGYAHAHDNIISANVASRKDFGTTCIVVGIVNQYLVTANCGDSSAICIIPNLYKEGDSVESADPDIPEKSSLGGVLNIGRGGCNRTGGGFALGPSFGSRLPDLPTPLSCNKPSSSRFHGIYYLSNPHSLGRKSERQRVDQSGVGKVVLGDYGMLRLIPSYLSYSQARDLGLSISMSRSLGHMHLSRCALLPTPDYRVLDMEASPPKKESVSSIRKRSMEEKLARIEDEKMAYFSEALIEESVIAIGWGKRLTGGITRSFSRPMENIELDWNTDDDAASAAVSNMLAINGGKSQPWRDSYIVIMSDGVSDILDAFAIADIIVGAQDRSMQEVAGLITSEAERKRRAGNIRADNCTVMVIRLRNKQFSGQQMCNYGEIIESAIRSRIRIGLRSGRGGGCTGRIGAALLERPFFSNPSRSLVAASVLAAQHTVAQHVASTANRSDSSGQRSRNLRALAVADSSPAQLNRLKSSETPLRSLKQSQFVHKAVTPIIQRRRKLTTPSPSPARARNPKVREIPNIFVKN